jgi:hypothetical protein
VCSVEPWNGQKPVQPGKRAHPHQGGGPPGAAPRGAEKRQIRAKTTLSRANSWSRQLTGRSHRMPFSSNTKSNPEHEACLSGTYCTTLCIGHWDVPLQLPCANPSSRYLQAAGLFHFLHAFSQCREDVGQACLIPCACNTPPASSPRRRALWRYMDAGCEIPPGPVLSHVASRMPPVGRTMHAAEVLVVDTCVENMDDSLTDQLQACAKFFFSGEVLPP